MLQTIMLLPAAGVLSMGRHNDPNSGTSSFSFLLGSAPHLDMQYTIFG
jgi:cyclophilin family peptidyl-prolyl cis-trans isomerase